MLDPPHHEGHNHQHGDADRETEGPDRPLTPSHLRPPEAGRAQADSGSDSSVPQSRSVEFELPSPVSPSRPRSPWALFDPYNNNEVKLVEKTQRGENVCVWFYVQGFDRVWTDALHAAGSLWY